MNPLVSIIIPAYNTAEYIDEMLDCVINQTYRNIEILIINDGSTDDTLKHINSYSDKDSRIKVFDIPNGGVSNARNIGIKHCIGEYIFCWDSDDIIELNAVESCINFLEENDVNAVLYGYSDRVNGVNCPQHNSILKTIYTNDLKSELLSHFIGHSFADAADWSRGIKGLREGKEHTALWRIMLNADVVRRNNLLFDTGLTIGEDTKFMCEYLLCESRLGYLDKCLYHLSKRECGAILSNKAAPVSFCMNKQKIIRAKLELDVLGRKQNLELHQFWEGSMIFSSVQLFIDCSKKLGLKGYRYCREFNKNSSVKKAYNDFRPPVNLKSLPFILIKHNMGILLYLMLLMTPEKLIKKFL